MSRLLVVEDEAHIASGLRFNLEADGHSVVLADTGEAALDTIAADWSKIDLVVLDVMLPGIDGFTVASRMRAQGSLIPILMLTARGRAEDVLDGFEAGADDYLQKPFELSILIARINALLRRHAWHVAARGAQAKSNAKHQSDSGATTPAAPDVYTFAGKTVDFDAQELRVRGKPFPLTLMEANLLRYLVQHEGKAVSRKSMLEDVWNLREDTDTRAIDHFIARLRKYIEKEPARPRHLQTVRGVGYKFVAAPK
jgi:DNA-binding response OmpR family regulator